MHSDLTTTQASKKLQEDLGLNYGLGKKIVSHFFKEEYTQGDVTFWSEKINYQELITLNGTIDYIKNRVKSKILKHWKKDLENLIPDSIDRRKLYMNVYRKRLERNQEENPLPNKLLQEILIEELGHWDPEHHKGIRDDNHTKTKKKKEKFTGSMPVMKTDHKDSAFA